MTLDRHKTENNMEENIFRLGNLFSGSKRGSTSILPRTFQCPEIDAELKKRLSDWATPSRRKSSTKSKFPKNIIF